jgi:hypothetical protein
MADRRGGPEGGLKHRPLSVQHLWCYTAAVPTRRPRHTVTETPPVERALRRLRALRPGQRIDFQELVALGAEHKAQQLEREGDEGERRRSLIEQFLELGANEDVDASAGLDIHESGWTRGA